MAFKILFGNEVNLPNEMVAGYLYCCTDSGNAFFDYPVAVGAAARKQISADVASKLLYNNGEDVVELLPEDIATKDDAAAAARDVVKTVGSADEMIDEHKLYIYTGVEPGMTSGALYYYNGSEWKPVSASGGSFDPSDISGGAAGQVLTKNSSDDGDYSWQDLPTFDGSYTIVPMIGAETQMNTAQTYLDRNITVERIPVYVTHNDSGGNTVIIGG